MGKRIPSQTKLYSPSTRGFYDRDVHGRNIPLDVFEISNAEHKALLEANAKGLDIVPGEGGRPIAQKRVPSEAEQRRNLTFQRDGALRETDGLIARHRDELELGVSTTITADQYRELQAYRVALRAAPQQKGFPACGLPPAPAFLAAAR